MFSLLTAFALFWSAISGQTNITITEPTLNGAHYQGLTYCYEGHAQIYLSTRATVDIYLHEFAHAYDCFDNGTLDGSPTPELCLPSLVCAEIYALHVQYTHDVSSLGVKIAESQGR